MIRFIKGTVQSTHSNGAIIDIGSIGLEIALAHPAALTVGSQVHLSIYMHWHQENGPSLYGFAQELDKTVFLMIIDCSGIGPKLGLSVLAHLGAKQFITAIQSNDDAQLSKVPGIGQKKAEQLIVQLRDKVHKLIKSGVDFGQSDNLEQWTTVTQTLTSLNYSRTEIAMAMKHLGETFAGKQVAFEMLMRQALSFLAKRV